MDDDHTSDGDGESDDALDDERARRRRSSSSSSSASSRRTTTTRANEELLREFNAYSDDVGRRNDDEMRKRRGQKWGKERARGRDDARALWCGQITAACAIGLFVLGFSAVGRSQYGAAYETQRAAYDERVAHWNEGARDTFERATFEFTASRVSLGTKTVNNSWAPTSKVTTRIERPSGTREGEVSAYEPLWYELAAVDLIEAVGIPELIASGVLDARDVATLDELAHPEHSTDSRPYTDGYNNTAVMEALTGMRALKIRVDGDDAKIVQLGEFELFTKETLTILNWKTCKYRFSGYSHGTSCDTYTAIDKVCFKLARDAGGDWVVDASYGGQGCAPRTVEDSTSGAFTWEPVSRRRILAPATGAYPALMNVRRALLSTRTLGVSAVSARHVADPRVWLLNITGGSGAFADREAKLNASGIACVCLACVFSIPAVALLVPLAVERLAERRARARLSTSSNRRLSPRLGLTRDAF